MVLQRPGRKVPAAPTTGGTTMLIGRTTTIALAATAALAAAGSGAGAADAATTCAFANDVLECT
jgi:hypothetical protein